LHQPLTDLRNAPLAAVRREFRVLPIRRRHGFEFHIKRFTLVRTMRVNKGEDHPAYIGTCSNPIQSNEALESAYSDQV